MSIHRDAEKRKKGHRGDETESGARESKSGEGHQQRRVRPEGGCEERGRLLPGEGRPPERQTGGKEL